MRIWPPQPSRREGPLADREKKLLRMIKKKLHELQLVDVWRIQHPGIKDYTYFSTVHGTYTRLDYILVEHRLLEEVTEAAIEISTFSDHSPVSMRINIHGEPMGRGAWRINEELLEGDDVVKIIIDEINIFGKTIPLTCQEQPYGRSTNLLSEEN